MQAESKRLSNKSLVFILLFLFGIMTCLTAASVPLYRLFCQATGFGGVTKKARDVSKVLGHSKIKVTFNSEVDKGLAWNFKPLQLSLETQVGANMLAFYEAENLTDHPIKGMAVYNVSPQNAGKFFIKVECFCFSEQTLQAHEKVVMPVLFYINPEIENEDYLKDLKELTLSYTFYPL